MLKLLPMFFLFIACDPQKSVFIETEDESEPTVEKANYLLEQKNPYEAYSILIDMVPPSTQVLLSDSDPVTHDFYIKIGQSISIMSDLEKRRVIPLLANSYAMQVGVDMVEVMAEIASIKDRSATTLLLTKILLTISATCEQQADDIENFINIMPDNASAALESLYKSSALMASITVQNLAGNIIILQDASKDQLVLGSIYDLVAFSNNIKAVSSDGKVSLAEAQLITDVQVQAMLRALNSANVIFANLSQQAFDSESSEFSKLQSKIAGFLSEIDAQERSSEEDKFRSWIVKTTNEDCSL